MLRRLLPPLLLLLLQSTWATLRVSVPSSPIRAPPGSDVRLPCNISVFPGSIDLVSLAVFWKVGEQTVAEYSQGFTTTRPGITRLLEKQLQAGDASLLLQNVQNTDAAVYTCYVIYVPEKEEKNVELRVEGSCKITSTFKMDQTSSAEAAFKTCGSSLYIWFRPVVPKVGVQNTDAAVYTCYVIYVPEKEEKNVELRVEAPPRLMLSSTKLQLAKPNAVSCKLFDFYPGNVSVEWLRDGVVVKRPESPPAQLGPDGLFTAESFLSLAPSTADAGANFSCRIRHRALDSPITRHFQLQVQARPSVQVITVPSTKMLAVANCLVSGFYPKEIHVQWLKNGEPQLKIQSEPQTTPDRTFTIQSVILPQESDPGASYVCQVQHEALDTVLKLPAEWKPNSEANGHPCLTNQHSRNAGKEPSSQPFWPTAISTSLTGSSNSTKAPEQRLPQYVVWLLGGAFLLLCLIVGIVYCVTNKSRKPNLPSDSKKETDSLRMSDNSETTRAILKSETQNATDALPTIL